MGWATEAAERLKRGEGATVRPRGHSMTGRIADGQLVTLRPAAEVKVGDAVLVKWRGSYLLHLVKAERRGQYLIGNNRGGVNGWVSRAAVLGVAVDV